MRAILLTGAPGAGKTTAAEHLARLMPASAHVPVDFFRKMVKAGYASPSDWNAEAGRQYRLARRSAAFTARTLAEGGFTPVIDDIIPEHWVGEWRSLLEPLSVLPILLNPPLDVCATRNRQRTIWTVRDDVLRSLHAMLQSECTPGAGWNVHDNTGETPEQTAAALFELISAVRS